MNINLPFKKKVLVILIAFLAIFSYISTSSAYSFKGDSGINTIKTQAGYGEDKTPEEYIGNILLLVFSFVGLVFFVLIIYAGIQWMTAQGNTSQVEKAKDTLIKAIVGLVIIMAAYGITFFFVNNFQSPTDSSSEFIDSPVDGDGGDFDPLVP